MIMETLPPPERTQQPQNSPEASGKLLPIAVDGLRLAYHGVLAAIETRRRAGSGATSPEPGASPRPEPVNALEGDDAAADATANAPIMTFSQAVEAYAARQRGQTGSEVATPEPPRAPRPGSSRAAPGREVPATDPSEPRKRTFADRFWDKRREKKEWKHQLAEAERRAVIAAYGGEASLPKKARRWDSDRRSVNSEYKVGRITAEERRARLKDIELNRPRVETPAQRRARQKVEGRAVLGVTVKRGTATAAERARRAAERHAASPSHAEARDQARQRLEASKTARRQLKASRRLERQRQIETVRRHSRRGIERISQATRYVRAKGKRHIEATREAYREGLNADAESAGVIQRKINRTARRAGQSYTRIARNRR